MRGILIFFSPSRGGFEHPQTNPEGEENCNHGLYFWLLLRLFVYSIIWLIVHSLSGAEGCTGCFIAVCVAGCLFKSSAGTQQEAG